MAAYRRVYDSRSGVTMGWLLRLVTGGPLVVGGPDSSIYFKSEGRGTDLRK